MYVTGLFFMRLESQDFNSDFIIGVETVNWLIKISNFIYYLCPLEARQIQFSLDLFKKIF